mmetsp:Transcript_84690/g.132307  ORF Transcript_84690/g.132307 Transcript_84690/m.132307 type:complete len:950 (+) Transcript_84690:21-2870(+)
MASLFEVVKCHGVSCLEGVTGNGVDGSNKLSSTKFGRSSPQEVVPSHHSGPADAEAEKDKLIAELKKLLEEKDAKLVEMEEEAKSDTRSEAESEAESTTSCDDEAPHYAQKKNKALVVTNVFSTLQSSALAFAVPAQIVIYLIAFGGVIFVLLAHSYPWGQPEHRRLQVNRITRTPTLFDPEIVGMRFEDIRMETSFWDSLDWQSSMGENSLSSTLGRILGTDDSDSHDDNASHDNASHDGHDHGNDAGASSSNGGGHSSSDGGHASSSGDSADHENGGHGSNSGDGADAHDHEDGHDSNHTGTHDGEHDDSHGSGHGSSDGHDSGGHQLIVNIAYCTVSAGLIALIINILQQPLLLGYILGGIFVGPIGLKLIESAEAINTISELGLILLLFMIGLELDVSELLKMGKVVILTGFLQFPICAITHLVFFMVLNAIGISFGAGSYSVMYMAVCCGISSTMIVVKLLSEKMETDSAAGRLTIGVLIFQDMWAIVVMAIQPNLANINPLEILITFCMMAALLIIAFAYSKYILPAVFYQASESMELLLVLSLAWCFYICCIALLPWFNLSMELAALIAGVAMATFPYSAELNGKVKYIRDYFITLYFVSLGMQIPPISIGPILKALLVCLIVLPVRWLGLYTVIGTLDGCNLLDNRLAVVATMNLSEVSEFGLVLCSIGKGLGHVETDTFTILIWVFSILAVGASYFIKFNHAAYTLISKLTRKCKKKSEDEEDHHEDGHGHHDSHEHDIVLLGYSRTAAALVSEVRERSPLLQKRLHVIVQHGHAKKMKKLKDYGVSSGFADLGANDVLEHALPHGEYDIQLVIITQTNDELKGYTNLDLMENIKKLKRCAKAKFICTASSGSTELYENGADYVLKPAKLQAERLADMLIGYVSNVGDDLFAKDAKAVLALQNALEDQVNSDSRRGGRGSIMLDDDEDSPQGHRAKKAKV